MVDKYLMLIDGKWVRANSKESFEVKNPATGEVLALVPKGDREDAKKALVAASKAFPTWAATPSSKGYFASNGIFHQLIAHG